MKNLTDKQIINLVKKEGNEKSFIYKGYPCHILRHMQQEGLIFSLCGYVGISKNNEICPKEDYSSVIECHGGITYQGDGNLASKKLDDNLFYIGFDCNHCFDIGMFLPSVFRKDEFKMMRIGTIGSEECEYRDMKYVEKELKSIVDQLIKLKC